MVSVVEPAAATRTKGRILVVDDELVVRDSLGKWFTSEGYTARPAGGAREALEIIQQAEFDIALLDIKMPGMDGMELQARLKEADPGPDDHHHDGLCQRRNRGAGVEAGGVRLHHQAGGSG